MAAIALLSNAAHAVEFFSPDWVIPFEVGTPYPAMTVNTGDSLTFAWSTGLHDVWIYPSGSCDPTGAIQVGSTEDNPTTYFFSEEEAGTTITFACDVGAHCSSGMIMDVNVLAAATVGEIQEEEVVEEIEAEEDIVAEVEADIEEEILADIEAVQDVEAEVEPEEEEAVAEIEPEEEEVVSDVEPEEEEIEVEVEPEEEEIEIEFEDITGDYGACYVCGSPDNTIENRDTIITLPNPNGPPIEVSCAQLAQDGLNGFIPEQSCGFITNRIVEPCGCDLSDFSCNICGDDDYILRAPDEVVILPDDPENPITCAELSTAASNGGYSPNQCSQMPVFAFQRCQCSPLNFTCSICGEGFEVNDPDALVEIPGYETTTCGALEESGLNGDLPPAQCIASERLNRASNPCGCGPANNFDECLICGEADLVPMSTDFNVSFTPFDSYTCQQVYEFGVRGYLAPGECLYAQEQASGCGCAPADYTCDFCGGDGMAMMNPDANFTILFNGENVNCGLMDAAGLDGTITPADCDAVGPAVRDNCGCAPVDFTCNICGDDSGLTVSEVDETFVPGEDITCAEAQAAGLAGQIDPRRCEMISPFAQFACGCQEGGTLSPDVEDEVVEVVATDVPVEPTQPVEDVEAEEPALDAVEITATDATDSVTPVEEDEADIGLVSDPGTATSSIEEAINTNSVSGTVAVSSTGAMTFTCLVGMLIASMLA